VAAATLAAVALAAATLVAGEAPAATLAVLAAAAGTLVAAAAAAATSAVVAVAAAAVAVELAAAEAAVAAESGSGKWRWRRQQQQQNGWLLVNVVDIGDAWLKINKRKHIFCIKISPFINYWMENVYHSHEYVLPDTKRQNVAKKAYLHAE
jgi:hypothetical protein